jgi:hypothetical protein
LLDILTYGGEDRVVEHASLFGYDITFKALRAWGDSYWGSGKNPPTKNLAGYHNPENGYTGYYMLTKNPRAYEALVDLVSGRQVSNEPIEWDRYGYPATAEQWDALIPKSGRVPRHYDKNGFKIAAAQIFESIYGLGGIEFALANGAPKPEAAAPKGKAKRGKK